MARIILLIAQDGFQVREYEDTKNVLGRAGHSVDTAAMLKTEAISNIGTMAKVDIAISDIDIHLYDGLYIIGGPGALPSLNNATVHALLRDCAADTTKYFGAICIAPRILALAGVINGVRITGWNADYQLGKICADAGAIYEEIPVVIDGRIITADGPMSARKFGEAIRAQW